MSRIVPVISWPVTFVNPYPGLALFQKPTNEHFALGNEYAQFYRALELNPTALPPKDAESLEYTITPDNHRYHPGGSFTIKGGSQAGGSSFAVQTESAGDTIGSCLVTDNFDSTYTVQCAPIKTNSARLTVDLTHTNFGAFLPFGPGQIVQEQMKVPLFTCEYEAHFKPHLPCQQFDIYGGWWSETRSSKPIYTPTSCAALPVVSLKDDCLSTPSFFFIGESHARFFYDFMLQSIGVNIGDLTLKHSDASHGNIHFKAAHYLSSGPEVLERTEFPKGSTVILTVGSWMLHGWGLGASIIAVQEVLLPALVQLRHVRVVFVSSPAKFKQEGSWAGIENTHSQIAFVQAVRMILPLHINTWPSDTL